MLIRWYLVSLPRRKIQAQIKLRLEIVNRLYRSKLVRSLNLPEIAFVLAHNANSLSHCTRLSRLLSAAGILRFVKTRFPDLGVEANAQVSWTNFAADDDADH